MMDEQEKKKIRPVYNELQGYLAQAPTIENAQASLDEPSEWEQINTAIDLLNTATKKDYTRFKISPETGYGGGKFIRVSLYRKKLGGLINYLYAEYFFDEPAPFSSIPSTVINQNQIQQQSVNVLILDIQKKIDEKLPTTEDEKEKGFLKRLEKLLPSITNGVQLVKAAFDLAAQMGLDPHQISRLFS